MLRLVLVVAVLLLSAGVAWGQQACPEGEWCTWAVNGHRYTLTTSHSNWTDAEAEAVARGGHLVTINDADENTWLTQTFPDVYARGFQGTDIFNLAWIGLEFQGTGSDDYGNFDLWKWTSGEPLTYTNPFSRFPEDPSGPHMYIHGPHHPAPGTWHNHLRHDTDFDWETRGIIEVATNIPTVSEWGVVVLTLLGMSIGTIVYWRLRVGHGPHHGPAQHLRCSGDS